MKLDKNQGTTPVQNQLLDAIEASCSKEGLEGVKLSGDGTTVATLYEKLRRHAVGCQDYVLGLWALDERRKMASPIRSEAGWLVWWLTHRPDKRYQDRGPWGIGWGKD